MAHKKLKKDLKKQPTPIKRLFAGTKARKGSLLWGALKLAFIAVFWAIFIGIMITIYYAHDLPDINVIAQQDHKPQITIRSADGTVLAKYGDLKGNTLTYSQLPTHLVQAIITAEDRRFFDHPGIDIFGIIRAYYVNLRAGRVVQGGSTVTQQLAKIIYLSPERTFKRKIQEMFIAIQLERNFSKEQIMSMYVNRVYLGKGNYGVDAAAKFYFGKEASEMNAFECAVIAAMLKAPSKYAPSNNLKLAIERARYILSEMEEQGYITNEEMRTAQPPSVLERGMARGALKNPYFTDYVLSQIPDLLENPNQDLNIFTTLDLGAQTALETAADKIMAEKGEKYKAHQVAGLAMEPNGAIKAMIGGRAYDSSQYNRAVVAKRQPGSAFKFFVFTAALEDGAHIEDVYEDKPVSYKQGKGLPLWTPKNFKNEYLGNMTLFDAFTQSINTITVQLSEKIGRAKTISLAKKLGVQSPLQNLPSIALGASEVSVLEMTQAMAHIANEGVKVDAFAILQIRNANNDIIYEHADLPNDVLLEHHVVQDMKSMLINVVDNGTGRAAKLAGRTVYGKTGTSQDHRDAWFIGATDDIVAGIWVGNDDNTPMNRTVGGNMPAWIWKEFVEKAGEIKRTHLPQETLPWKEEDIFDALFGHSEASDEKS